MVLRVKKLRFYLSNIKHISLGKDFSFDIANV